MEHLRRPEPVLSENAITPSSKDSAMDRLSRLPSTRCEGSGHVGSCGPSSISLSSSCFGCSYCPFAPNGPTGSNCSLSATKSQYFDARWDDLVGAEKVIRACHQDFRCHGPGSEDAFLWCFPSS